MNITAARAVLKQHGIDPNADPETLTAAIEERGWRVSLEQPAERGSGGRPRRWRLLATQAPEVHKGVIGVYPHLVASGPNAQTVLIRVLAQALEHEQPPARG